MLKPEEKDERTAEYLANVIKRPAGLARTMFRIHAAMLKEGFTEKQAMEITQFLTAMIIGLGGMIQ